MKWWNIRKATIEDKPAILRIAHQYSQELGYVHPIAISERIIRGTVLVAENESTVLGFVDYHVPQRGENKGYNVVYHLAVSREHLCGGIGRALLYSVPCPIRLKCTQDNARANAFYKGAGMFLAGTEAGNKRGLNIWQLNVLYCLVRGGNDRLPEIARQSGMAYGMRNDYSTNDWCFMVDIEWKDYDWKDYLELLSEYRPTQAMVADYEHPAQRKLLYQQIRDLKTLGIQRIMACPKFDGAVKHIPSWCVIAISVPAPTYAGFVASDLSEYAGRKCHLLGGSPKKQIAIMQQVQGAGGKIISMDGNYHANTKKSNQVYVDGTFRLLKPHEKVDYYQQIAISGRNIVAHVQRAAESAQYRLAI